MESIPQFKTETHIYHIDETCSFLDITLCQNFANSYSQEKEVIIALDRSGSMSGSYMEITKKLTR